ncbi:hypothetical protein [Exiguobacterium sp. s146]|uniref:lipopolysaccharide biosynthesis protein n=1 Tax=Exiguobacterium sp. s146 TaxID=2751223 RepID=UPI001BEBBB11|nr:hypothetical protein [Exiguobacterium sp. s146]
MTKPTRLQATYKNAKFGLISQIILYSTQFISRTIFIQTLGVIYLGINGLFTNILTILSLAELGLGSAITFSLYKPLADNDKIKISGLMNLFRKAYLVIGIIVLIIGLSLIPFLNIFFEEKPDVENLEIIFLLFLINTVSTYLLSYKRSIIIADQKNYIIIVIHTFFTLFMSVLQIMILIVFESFIIYLCVQIIATISINLFISQKADKMYPYLKKSQHIILETTFKAEIFRKIRAMSYHQIGQVLVIGTDNLLISMFIGINFVGIYSNYLMIIGVISALTNQLLNSVAASIGNATASESIEKNSDIFQKLFFGTFIIFSFCSVSLFTLLNPFIEMWLGKEYLLSNALVILIIVNFYLSSMRRSVLSYRNALGLYYQDRYKPLVEVVINLVSSYIFIQFYGLAGVFLGTILSTLATSVWIEPYILYKYYFKKNLLNYAKSYIQYILITIIITIFAFYSTSLIFNGTWITLVFSFISVFATYFIFILFFFKGNKNYIYYRKLFLKKIKKI